MRSALDRNSVPRRILFLAAALHRKVDEYPRSVFPETWEVLDRAIAGWDGVNIAQVIFDAQEVSVGDNTIVPGFS